MSKEKVKADHVEGIDFVRPPLLDMKKIKETKDYKEYKVTTFESQR